MWDVEQPWLTLKSVREEQAQHAEATEAQVHVFNCPDLNLWFPIDFSDELPI